MLDHALEYAAAGFRVFPIWSIRNNECACGSPQCTAQGKHPLSRLVSHGLNDATDDEDTIRRWWTAEPDANIGLRTSSKHFVIDCDRKGGVDGTARFLLLCDERGPIPETAASDTGGGGLHLLFEVPDSLEDVVTIRNQQGLRLDSGERIHGVDVRGEGGYVVAPPSVHASGRTYTWRRGLEHLQVAPDWLIQLVAKSPEPEHVPAAAVERVDLDIARIQSALAVIPAACDRQTWLEGVAMPLHDMSHGSEDGFRLFHEWSKGARGESTPTGNPAYQGEVDCRRVWRSLKPRRNPKGERTLWATAYEHGWQNGTTAQPAPARAPQFCADEIADAQGGAQDPGPFPLDLVAELQGPAAEMVSWIVDASRRPDPVIAFGAMLGIVSASLGRRVEGPGNTRANLVVAVLAPSGSGKDRPQDCLKNLLAHHPDVSVGMLDDTPTHRAQLDELLLKNKGQALMLLDEYGAALSRWLSIHDSASSTMSPAIRRLASHGHSLYRLAPVSLRHPARAANVSAWDAGIYAPSLAVLGYATPGQFYGALSESALLDGFLGRHLLIESQGLGRLKDPTADPAHAPDAVNRWMAAVEDFGIPRTAAPLSNYVLSRAIDPERQHPDLVDWADEVAQSTWGEMIGQLDTAAIQALEADDEIGAAVLRRLPGQVASVALVLACAEGPPVDLAEDWRIHTRHLEMAYRTVRWGADRMLWQLRMGVARDDLGRAYAAICETIERRAPAKVWRSYFTRRLSIASHLDRAWKILMSDARYTSTQAWARQDGSVTGSVTDSHRGENRSENPPGGRHP